MGLQAPGVGDLVAPLADAGRGLLEDPRRRRRDVLGPGLDGDHAPLRPERVHVVADDVGLPLLGHVLVAHVRPGCEHRVLGRLRRGAEHGHHRRPPLRVPHELAEHPRGELHADHPPVADDVGHVGRGRPAGRSEVDHARVRSERDAPPPGGEVRRELAPPGVPLAVLRAPG